MSAKSTRVEPYRYSLVAVILHWMIAILILFNLSVGYMLDSFGPEWRLMAVQLHISAGITVLVLTGLRVLWRLAHRPPERATALRPLEQFLANFVHLGLYGAMLLMPLSGWALISANPPRDSAGWHVRMAQLPPAIREALDNQGPFTFWKIVDLPMIKPLAEIGAAPEGLEPQKALHDDFVHWHETGGYLLLALLALHLAGALKHEWFDGEAELSRMAIGRRASKEN